jgi:tartrate dehydrogenase/decarboxylase / D-malate dehydrogenase
MNQIKISVLAGDGIGQEVIPGALSVLRAAASLTGSYTLETVEYPWSCEWYAQHGEMMPADGLDRLGDSEAILLGAVGFPGVPDHVSLRGLLLPIRQAFDQYANVRPIRLWPGVSTPLAGRGPDDLDILCIRENTEGEYSGSGGITRVGGIGRVATQVAVFSEPGIERIARYAMTQARRRRSRVASATKSNALQFSAVLWDDVVASVASEFPEVEVTNYHVDALAARFVSAPQTLDVVVASNLFGDILTDLGAALQGSLGLAASANLNPEGKFPSMFEPVHGSAPDIAGRGIANPAGAIWSAAMMLDHLGQTEAATLVLESLKATIGSGVCTADLGGSARTQDVVNGVLSHLGAPLTRNVELGESNAGEESQ